MAKADRLLQLLPATTNVVRFPVERRACPTLARLRELAPDAGEVLAAVDAFGLPDPLPDLRERADAEMARHILDAAIRGEPLAPGALDRMLDPVIAVAIKASWSARDGSAAVARALHVLSLAQRADDAPCRQPVLRERRAHVRVLQRRMAGLLIEAHARAEQAEGVARAIGFARRGELWTPPGTRADTVAALATTSRGLGYKSKVRPPIGHKKF